MEINITYSLSRVIYNNFIKISIKTSVIMCRVTDIINTERIRSRYLCVDNKTDRQ